MSNVFVDNVLTEALKKKNGDPWFPADAAGVLQNDGAGNLSWFSSGAGAVEENDTEFQGQVTVDSEGNTLYYTSGAYQYTKGQVLQELLLNTNTLETVAVGATRTTFDHMFTPKSPNSRIIITGFTNFYKTGGAAGEDLHAYAQVLVNGSQVDLSYFRLGPAAAVDIDNVRIGTNNYAELASWSGTRPIVYQHYNEGDTEISVFRRFLLIKETT